MSDEDITTDTNMNDNTFDDGSWIARNWRPLAALTYLTICLFDFIMFDGSIPPIRVMLMQGTFKLQPGITGG